MNIYTRYGDRGFTRLVGGGRAKKKMLPVSKRMDRLTH